MNRLISLLFVSLAAFAQVQSAEFKIDAYTFTLPEGFTLEKVAGPPLVNRPISADFDEQGRLYVTDSSGSNDKVEKQLQEKPHRIVCLQDNDGDGRFDKSTVFADRMMFPEGLLWFNGAVYCGAPPSIWKLEDTDSDGIADRRTEWFQGKTLGGCANDIHGPYLGPDGWIYWCKGAFAKQTYERPGLPTISDSAAHMYRCRPDGSGIDSVMSGGMDNPVEVAFTPTGDAIFSTTFYVNPQAGKRDALVHAIYGSVFPKVHGVLDGLKRTGDLMPPLTHLGPAAPCGLTRYSSTVFGSDYEGNLFSCQFNLHKIQRHVLEPAGATFKSRDVDFLVCDSTDFHPTDVLEDADGSLLVLDTGGWYKLCCPTSQLWKPDVLGAIYRIRRTGAPRIEDPRGLKLKWKSSPAALAKLLDDSRFAVRNRAMAELAKLGSSAVAALSKLAGAKSTSVLARLNAVWTLTRIEAPSARKAVRTRLTDPDPTVQQAAAHACGLYRDADSIESLQRLLVNAPAPLKREAATALGQIGNKRAVPALLDATRNVTDRSLEHSLIYALIQIDDPASTHAGLKTATPQSQRATLIALDQMDHGDLAAAAVVPLLSSSSAVLKETAGWICAHHPKWAGELRAYFKEQLEQPASASNDLQGQLVQFVREEPIQQLITEELSRPLATDTRALLLSAIADSNVKAVPTGWPRSVASALRDNNEQIAKAGLRAARVTITTNRSDSPLNESLLALARNSQRNDDLRLDALALAPAGSTLDDQLFAFSLAHLDTSKPPLQRINAASVLGRSSLSQEQLLQLASALPKAGPLELSRLLPAFGSQPSEEIGLKMVDGLQASKALTALPADGLRASLAKFPQKVQDAGKELLRSLNTTTEEKKKRLDEFEAALAKGDHRRGQAIFNSAKAACSTCHAVGYLGGQIGPDLTRIGGIRNQRDLLEAILYPSASFARGFEPMVVITKDGEQYSGLVRREASDSLVLVSALTAEQRIARADIAEMRPGTVSIMPEGLDQQLTRQEMADLVAFLKALK